MIDRFKLAHLFTGVPLVDESAVSNGSFGMGPLLRRVDSQVF